MDGDIRQITEGGWYVDGGQKIWNGQIRKSTDIKNFAPKQTGNGLTRPRCGTGLNATSRRSKKTNSQAPDGHPERCKKYFAYEVILLQAPAREQKGTDNLSLDESPQRQCGPAATWTMLHAITCSTVLSVRLWRTLFIVQYRFLMILALFNIYVIFSIFRQNRISFQRPISHNFNFILGIADFVSRKKVPNAVESGF